MGRFSRLFRRAAGCFDAGPQSLAREGAPRGCRVAQGMRHVGPGGKVGRPLEGKLFLASHRRLGLACVALIPDDCATLLINIAWRPVH